MGRRLTISVETYPLTAPFVIARSAKMGARQIEVTLENDGKIGRGAAVLYARYGGCLNGAAAAVDSLRPKIETGLNRWVCSTPCRAPPPPPLVDVVDLDGALFLAADDEGGVVADGARLTPPHLWGTPR